MSNRIGPGPDGCYAEPAIVSERDRWTLHRPNGRVVVGLTEAEARVLVFGAMRWTDEPPTVAGWCWVSAPMTDGVGIAELNRFVDGQLAFAIGGGFYFPDYMPAGTRFAGPIPPPPVG